MLLPSKLIAIAAVSVAVVAPTTAAADSIPPLTADSVAEIAVPGAPKGARGVPGRWLYTTDIRATLPADDAWWQTFEDPTLTRLIQLGQKNNYNISAALHRIAMNRQLWKEAGAAYFPTVNLSAGWTAMQQSSRTTSAYRQTSETDYFTLGADMSWEIDLFGRIRERRKQAKAAVNASRADFAGVQLSVAANIAKAYFTLRMYQAQLATAVAQDSSQLHILKIAEARKDVGLASRLDVAQARQVMITTESTVPALEAMVQTSFNSLALLTGEYPDVIRALVDGGSPTLPAPGHTVAAGTPADLLRRRPDVVAAEYTLAGYAAQAGMAKKDFLPTLTLNGSIGTAAHKPGDLFASHSFDWQVAPTLSWTLFDGLARNYSTAAARQQMQAALDQYNLTLMTAVQEVDNAIISYTSSLRTLQLYTDLQQQTDQTLKLSLALYKQGLSDFTNVMSAQISVLSARNSVITAHADALQKLVTLYQALGGGWDGDIQ